MSEAPSSSFAVLTATPRTLTSMADIERKQEILEARLSAHEQACAEEKGRNQTKWTSHDRWTEKHDEADRANHLAVTHRSNNLEVRVRAIETTVVKYTSISAVVGSVFGSAITGIIVYYLTTGGPA